MKNNTIITDPAEVRRIADRVSFVTIVVNILLSAFKLAAGIIAHSGAMISDAVHSASDVLSTFIVILGVRLAAKKPDSEHSYGHERMECVAAIILAMILFLTGLGIAAEALRIIFSAADSGVGVPGILALIAAPVSIAVKEWMYHYTIHHAKRINSGALTADAWHHRSDALSSVGALIGIGGAMLGVPILEPAASLVISVFIAKAAYDIFKDATDKMVDRSCGKDTEDAIRACAEGVPSVLGVDLLKTRIFGNRVYVDIEIRADGSCTLQQAHSIADAVHDEIESAFPEIKHIMVHVNPA